MSWHLDEIVKAVDGKCLARHQEVFDAVGTDTRKDLQHQLFVALRGAQFDAHQFLGQAVANGAAGLLVDDITQLGPSLKEQVTLILVDDTLKALQKLAKYVRHQRSAIFVGVAGSNGKTTSKEFCADLIQNFRKVHRSHGSFNNHWGVPLTLLATPEDCEVAIVEMGMNHSGELAQLAQIADVDVAVCTYVGVEHIEHFLTLEKIAEAEEEIYLHSPAKAHRIFNLDNPYTRQMRERAQKKFAGAQISTFSNSDDTADVVLKIADITMQEMNVVGHIRGQRGEASIPIFGAHNLTNAMVAASVGISVGLTPDQVWSALPSLKTNWGRNQLVQTQSGTEILFDSYNANPDSMKALIDNVRLIRRRGKLVGVFGEMLELGNLSSQLHEEVGAYVAQSPFDLIWFCGPHDEDFLRGLQKGNSRAQIVTSKNFDATIASQIASGLSDRDIVLVKGSRGIQLERFVQVCKPLDFQAK